MIRIIARKELTEIVRDGRLRVLGALVLILAVAALEDTSPAQSRCGRRRDGSGAARAGRRSGVLVATVRRGGAAHEAVKGARLCARAGHARIPTGSQ